MKYPPIIAALLLCAYLGLHNGYVALFESDKAEPIQVLPYRAALYPKLDQDALEKGIPIRSSSQMKVLLEDFTS